MVHVNVLTVIILISVNCLVVVTVVHVNVLTVNYFNFIELFGDGYMLMYWQ
jgi:hypothetical protein